MDIETQSELLETIGSRIYSPETADYSRQVCDVLKTLKLGGPSLAVGYLLQADIKDNAVRKLIGDSFGAGVVSQLELLARIGSVNVPESKEQISGLRKLFINLTDDLLIIIIKLAERLIALKHKDSNNDKDVKRIAEECLYLYSPIAHRLGIRKIYTGMEDIAFKSLFPDDFRKLSKSVEKKRTEYERKLAVISNDLKTILAKNNITFRLQSRVKRLYSIFRKLKARELEIDDIFDLLALRVITNSPESCYLTLGVVHSNWIPIDGRFRDWITFPKPNGYRSIQTTVLTRSGDKFEIQIRTEDMHQEAEYGSSAHWAYKEGISSYETGIMQLKEFLENDEYFDNPHELLEKLKSEMKTEHIHVLTPKGDIRALPVGSTPVDYAFSIHTDLGYQITGARVNGKFVKLTTTLKSGDVIDIISNKNAKPSRDWLNFVVTSRARSKIMRWFKNNERVQFINDGKQSFEILKKRYKKELAGKADDLLFRRYVEKIGFASADDFFFSMATGGVKPSRNLLAKIYPDAFQKPKKTASKASVTTDRKLEPQIKVEGMHNIETKLAKCCNPIKGEDIVAYVTRKTGIKIHRTDCNYLKSQSIQPDNLKNAEWAMKDSVQIVKIRLFGESYSKMIRELADVTDTLKIDLISTGQVSSKSKNAIIQAEIKISDISQLDKLRLKLTKTGVVDSMKAL